MSISEERFYTLSRELVQRSTQLELKLLSMQKKLAEHSVDKPEGITGRLRVFKQLIEEAVQEWVKDSNNWVEQALPKAYLEGIHSVDDDAQQVAGRSSDDFPGASMVGAEVLLPAAGGSGAGIPPSTTAIRLLERYPEHLTMYQVFEAAAKRELRSMSVPIIRDTNDMFRQIAIQSGSRQYLEGNIYTRRQMSQDMLSRFADRGITAKMYDGGRRVSLSAYSEMVSRTQAGNAARQAALNRQLQWGDDLCRVSAHSAPSDLCAPWQGQVYSITGKSDQYPSLQTAIGAGLYHPNCKHTQSPYFPGLSDKVQERSDPAVKKLHEKYGKTEGNRIAYEATQRQRQIERYIRKWKNRQATAITDAAKKQAGSKIRQWQAAQRRHIKQNPFLRRKYFREQIS